MNPGPKPKIYPSSLDDFVGAADYLFERDRRRLGPNPTRRSGSQRL